MTRLGAVALTLLALTARGWATEGGSVPTAPK